MQIPLSSLNKTAETTLYQTPYPHRTSNQPQPSPHTFHSNGLIGENAIEASPKNTTTKVRVLIALGETAQKIRKLAFNLFSKIFTKFKELWEDYGKKIVDGEKIILKATLLFANDETISKIKHCITYLGLTQLINLILDVINLKERHNKFKSEILVNDKEGITWSAVNLVKDYFELTERLVSIGTTFEKLNFFNLPFISLFSMVSLPLELTLLTFNTVDNIYKLIKNSIELHSLTKLITKKRRTENIIHYLDSKVGITEKEITDIVNSVYKECGIIHIGDKHLYGPSPFDSKPDAFATKQLSEKFTLTAIAEKNDPLSRKKSPPPYIEILGLNKPIDSQKTKLQQEAQKEVKRRIKVLKARKLNRLERNSNRKIVNYMLNARVHINLGKLSKLFKYNKINLNSEHFIEYFCREMNNEVHHKKSKTNQKKIEKQKQLLSSYFNVLCLSKNEQGKTKVNILEEDIIRIRKKFNKISKDLDTVLEGYMIDHKFVLEQAANSIKTIGVLSFTNHLTRISHNYSGNLDNLSRHLRPQTPSPCRFDNVLRCLRTNLTQHLAQFPLSICEKCGLILEKFSHEQKVQNFPLKTIPYKVSNHNSHQKKSSIEKTIAIYEKIKAITSIKSLAKSATKDLKVLFIKQLALNALSASINLIEWVMEILNKVLAPLAATIAKLGLSSIKLGFSIFKFVYKDWGMCQGLKNPQFCSS